MAGEQILERPRHEAFAQSLATGMSITDAYEEAGFKRHLGNSSRLSKTPAIKARVAFLQGLAADRAVTTVVTRAAQFDTVATESLSKAIKMLAKIKVDTCKASDIRALVEVSERASKMYELLEGRATDRTDDLTRGKMDVLMGEMKQEIEERLARVPTVH